MKKNVKIFLIVVTIFAILIIVFALVRIFVFHPRVSIQYELAILKNAEGTTENILSSEESEQIKNIVNKQFLYEFYDENELFTIDLIISFGDVVFHVNYEYRAFKHISDNTVFYVNDEQIQTVKDIHEKYVSVR